MVTETWYSQDPQQADKLTAPLAPNSPSPPDQSNLYKLLTDHSWTVYIFWRWRRIQRGLRFKVFPTGGLGLWNKKELDKIKQDLAISCVSELSRKIDTKHIQAWASQGQVLSFCLTPGCSCAPSWGSTFTGARDAWPWHPPICEFVVDKNAAIFTSPVVRAGTQSMLSHWTFRCALSGSILPVKGRVVLNLLWSCAGGMRVGKSTEGPFQEHRGRV